MEEFSPALLEHLQNHFRDFQWIPFDDNRHACIPFDGLVAHLPQKHLPGPHGRVL